MTEDKLIDLWSEDELDRALGALHDDVPTDPARLEASRATFLAAIDRPVRRKRRSWTYALTAAAAVTTLVVGGFLVTTNSPGGTAEAKAELNSAADHVVAKDPVIPPGKYRYRVSHAWIWHFTETSPNEGVTYLQEQLTETWIPADRTQEWMQRSRTTGQRKLIHGTQQQLDEVTKDDSTQPEVLRGRCGDFYLDPGQQPCTRAGGWQDPTPDWAAGLPTDPKALYKRLKKDAPRNSRGETELLVYAADALRTGQVPANVRSTLYRALGNLNHLEVSDRAVNLDGKVGIAYGSDDGEERQEIIIDPRTGDYIGERQVVTSGDRRGQVIGFSSVTSSIVDRMGDRQ